MKLLPKVIVIIKHLWSKRLYFWILITDVETKGDNITDSTENKKTIKILQIIWNLLMNCTAHGRMVTSSRQITEVKQRRARLVLGWVTAARSSHPTGHV